MKDLVYNHCQVVMDSDSVKVSDDVGSVSFLTQTSERHFVSRNVFARVHQVHEQVLVRPDNSWAFQGLAGRVGGASSRSSNDSSQNWSSSILSITLESVTDWTLFFEEGLSGFGISLGNSDVGFFNLFLLLSSHYLIYFLKLIIIVEVNRKAFKQKVQFGKKNTDLKIATEK